MAFRYQVAAFLNGEFLRPLPETCGIQSAQWQNITYPHTSLALGSTFSSLVAILQAGELTANNGAFAGLSITGPLPFPIQFEAEWSAHDPAYIALNAGFDILDDATKLAAFIGEDAAYAVAKSACPEEYPLAAVPGAYRFRFGGFKAFTYEYTEGAPPPPPDMTGGPTVAVDLLGVINGAVVSVRYTSPEIHLYAYLENPTDPDGTPAPLDTDPAGLPPDGYSRLNEIQLIGLNRWPALDPAYALLNRRSITRVLNGFFESMEDFLLEFPDKEDFTAMQVEVDMDTNRIVDMAEATAPNDLVTKAQVEGVV